MENIIYATNLEELEIKMKQTPQFTNLNVLEHGQMVSKYFKDFKNKMNNGIIFDDFLYEIYHKHLKYNLLDDL